MLENILKSVTDAEAKAEAIIRDAEQKGLKMADEARKEAAVMKEATANRLKTEYQEQSRQMQMLSQQQLEDASQMANKDATDLKGSVEMKKKEAIKAVIAQMI